MISYLILGSLSILIGPLLYHLFARSPGALRAIDGFVFVSIAGLLIEHLIVEIGEPHGFFVLAALVLGLLGPLFIERTFHRIEREIHLLTLLAGAIGFFIHSLFDGVALSPGVFTSPEGSQSVSLLATAVIIHRIPVGLTLWWLLRPRFGAFIASLSLGLTIGTTILGYLLSSSFLVQSIEGTYAWVEAFIVGSILHVVFFRIHLHQHGEVTEAHCSEQAPMSEPSSCCDSGAHSEVGEKADSQSTSSPILSSEGIGNLIGICFLLSLFFLGGGAGDTHHHGESAFVETFLTLLFESAPALFLAYFLGVFIYGFFPQGSIRWLQSGGRLTQSAKGMLVGLPLPICSCGVLPYYQTLIKKGAPPAAAIAFLIATPELGLDAVILSLPLLGGEITTIRLVACAIIAFVVSYLVSKNLPPRKVLPVLENEQSESSVEKIQKGMRFAFFELIDTTAPWMLLGLGLGAVFAPILHHLDWNLSPFVEVPLFSCLGLVTYVCASGATPLIAALIAGGISPGAGLAFLITGPATNVSTFGVLRDLHGKRVAFQFAILMIVSAIFVGYSVEFFLGDISTKVAIEAHHHGGYPVWRWAAVIGLSVLYLWSFLRQGGRKFFSHIWVS